MKHGGTYILVFIFLIFTCALSAQVNIKAGVSRDKILIGETVSLTIDAYVPIGAEVSWFPSDSIEHFEVIKRSPADTVANIDGKKITLVLTITSFDSGRWTIPPFEVTVGGKPYYSDSLSIDVTFISFDPREDYHDIKDIIVVEDPALKYIPWIIFAVSLVSLALLVFLCRRMTKVPVRFVKNNITSISAYEEAMNALEELKKKGVPDGNEKIYYTEMNDILRKYVSGKFGISTFERTNEELILQLTAMNLPQKPFSSLIQSLRMSDFVKFAKYRPSEEDNIHNLDVVRSSIDLLNNYSGSAV